MSVRLHYSNLIDATGVVITESSEQTDLPSSNVANAHRTLVWRSGTSVAEESVVFDLLSAQAVTSIIALNHTLLAGDSLIKIQGNATDSWGAPSFSQTLTWAADEIYAVFASQSYRYWRFTYTKASAGVTRDIGRIFLGAYVTLDRDPDTKGYDGQPVDRSITRRTLGGQTYTWAQDSYLGIKLPFTGVTEAVKVQLTTLAAVVGTHTPFFFYLDSIHDSPLYVKLTQLGGRKVGGGFSGAYRWNMELSMAEEL